MLNHGDLHRSSNSKMDLEPSAPYASASSFPSPAEYLNVEDPSITYDKLQQISEGGSLSSASFYPKLPFGSTKGVSLGIDMMASKFFPPALPQSFQPFAPPAVAPPAREKRPLGPYLSQNKIAYRISATAGGPTSSSALQGILQRCGIGNTPVAPDTAPMKQQLFCDSLDRPTSSRITEKIRNLDDMLKSLDHYSVTKRIASTGSREPVHKSGMESAVKHRRPSEIAEAPLSEHPSHETSGVEKSISRLEFKAQMDKLTGVIEDRWFYGGSRKVETKTVGEAGESASSAKNDSHRPPQQERLPPVPTGIASITSTTFLEEMLRRVAGLERRLTKRDRQKQSKKKGLDARGRRLSIQRPAGKRMLTTVLQRQFKIHAASINQRLDKTDLAIKSLRRQQVETISPFLKEVTQNGSTRAREFGNSNDDVRTPTLDNPPKTSSRTEFRHELVVKGEAKGSFAEDDCVENQDAVFRNMQQMQDELRNLRKENQYTSHTLEKILKQFNDQSMEIELCWAAINHLCIDSDTFRDELRALHTPLQEQPESSEHINVAGAYEKQQIRTEKDVDKPTYPA